MTTVEAPSIAQPRVAVIQDGARRHYIVPAALQETGMLEKVFTEWYVKPWSLERAIGLITPHLNKKLGQRMNERHRDGLDTRFVEHSPLITLRQRLSQKKFASMEDYYRWCSRETGKWILRKGFGNANALYGFIRNVDPSVFAACRKLGIQTLGDQMIAPAVVERDENRRQLAL
jgi:hypothetical protein